MSRLRRSEAMTPSLKLSEHKPVPASRCVNFPTIIRICFLNPAHISSLTARTAVCVGDRYFNCAVISGPANKNELCGLTRPSAFVSQPGGGWHAQGAPERTAAQLYEFPGRDFDVFSLPIPPQCSWCASCPHADSLMERWPPRGRTHAVRDVNVH